MNLRLVKTADGSSTLYHPELDEHFHSAGGAIAESKHVFIEAGLQHVSKNTNNLCLLEVGLGTGLNALLTALEARDLCISVDYHAIEPFPIEPGLVNELKFAEFLKDKNANNLLAQIHDCKWENDVQIEPHFKLYKSQSDIEKAEMAGPYDLVFFDAFAPKKVPDQWSVSVFNKVRKSMKQGAVLVTYASTGFVKRNLREAGFDVQRLTGANGKHHMLRACAL